jgi:crossover junction endodeoxyribonuclease RusA
MEPLTLKLPWPPSVNGIWRSFRGRAILSKKARQYSLDCYAAILSQERRKFTGRLWVELQVFPPDHRKIDIDNRQKLVNDCLTKAGIWIDDEQIDHLTIIRRCVRKGGLVIVTIKDI